MQARANGVKVDIRPHHWGDNTTPIQTTLQGRQCLTITFQNQLAGPELITWVCADVHAYARHLAKLTSQPGIKVVSHGTSLVAH